MAKKTPMLRAGILTVERVSTGERIEIAVESDAWFTWLQTSRTFAFDDASGHFTARKKQRLGTDYWYAFRRRGSRFCEIYLGKSRDITLERLRAAAARLEGLAGGASHHQAGTLVSNGRPIARSARTSSREEPHALPSPKVTPREREILGLVASGATNEEIARELVISHATVKRHVSNILTALSVRNRTQAVARARALGLFDFSGDSPNGVHAR